MKRIIATTAITLSAIFGVSAPTVEARPSQCAATKTSYGAFAYCSAGTGHYIAVASCRHWTGRYSITAVGPRWEEPNSGVASKARCPGGFYSTYGGMWRI